MNSNHRMVGRRRSSEAKQYDMLLRVLLIGDSGVGKTCILYRFVEDDFTMSHISTIGIDFKLKTVEVNGKRIRVQIWDTAGQERYETITKQYYRRAQGVLLVYDVTSEKSFTNISKWANDVDEYAPEDVERMLIANKSDDRDWRVISKQQGQKLADLYRMSFFETSAYRNVNIKEAFLALTNNIIRRQGIIPAPDNSCVKDGKCIHDLDMDLTAGDVTPLTDTEETKTGACSACSVV
ncbi:ras-related protein Rab-15-like isoform X1 [Branchiostoma floridae]|uniref:Ras-related protein Rab-15 n=2 Tax=Branchiostoma floridae TaxID=7739 RepID=A0A9J7LTY6_BRAFL|nr:ras-related protein Rab-15-like isoform X1 [Branchiostoma floridae]XP_035688548.1 ras-related protein Rab-15-like isoform X1 [Branchiostoma floridae]